MKNRRTVRTFRERVVAAVILLSVAAAAAVGASALTTQILEPPPRSDKPIAKRAPLLINDAGPSAVVVEAFMDFECEGCSAIYPAIEQIRAEFSDRVTIVLRHYPSRSHVNAINAAQAVEAAAEQGQFEPMYQRILSTQYDWADAQKSEASLFRKYALDLGLDLERYDAVVASSATARRIEAAVAHGQAEDVSEVPSFLVEDKPIDGETSAALRVAILRELDT